jgi:hypothetical protein
MRTYGSAILLVASVTLGGCATSAAGLANSSVRETIPSQKSARDVAMCVVDSLNWSGNDLRGSDGHWWVIRVNGGNVPTIRWDFIDRSTGGSVAELRHTIGIGKATDKVRSCA